MTTINENLNRPYAAIVQEVGGYYSRDTGVISNGAGVIPNNAVLGRVTASGEYVMLDPAATDGSQVAAAIAPTGGDATSSALTLTLIVRSAEIRTTGLTFAATVTDPQKTQAIAELKSLGLVAR